MAFALGIVVTEGDPYRTLQDITLAAHVLDDDVAQFLRQGSSPVLGAREVLIAQKDIEDVGSQGTAGRNGDGLVVQFPAEFARYLYRLHPSPRTGGEDAADGLFDATLNPVKQAHGLSPSASLTLQYQ
jgi:hypothetical protein